MNDKVGTRMDGERLCELIIREMHFVFGTRV